MKQVLLSLTLFSISFLLGNYYILNAYNPTSLENNTVYLTKLAFFNGCMNGIKLNNNLKEKTKCIQLSNEYKNNIEKIIHQKIYKSR